MAVDTSLQAVVAELRSTAEATASAQRKRNTLQDAKDKEQISKLEKLILTTEKLDSLEKELKELQKIEKKVLTEEQRIRIQEIQQTQISQDTLKATKDNVIESKALRKETVDNRSESRKNIDFQIAAQAKVQKAIEDAGGKADENNKFLQNQIVIDQELLNLRRQELENPTTTQLLALNRQQLEIDKKQLQINGQRAEDNLDFQKQMVEQRKAEARDRLNQENITAAAAKEARKDLRNAQIEGIKLAFDPVVGAFNRVSGAFNFVMGKVGLPMFSLGRVAGLVAIVGLIKFLRSDLFDEIIDALAEFDPRKIVDNLKASIFSLEGAMAAIVLTVGGLASRLLLSAGLGGSATRNLSKTKLTAKDIGIKQGELIKSKSGTFKLTKGGDLRQFDPTKGAKGSFVGKAVNQDQLLRKLASEGALGERGKIITGKGSSTFFKVIKGILKRVPGIAQFLALQDLIGIFTQESTTQEKFEQLVGILGGLGGGALGALVGGFIGSFGSPFTFGLSSLFGTVGGGIYGYFKGEEAGKQLAAGIAEVALGMKVKSFPVFDKGPFAGYDLNNLFNPSTKNVPELDEDNISALEALSQSSAGSVKVADTGDILFDGPSMATFTGRRAGLKPGDPGYFPPGSPQAPALFGLPTSADFSFQAVSGRFRTKPETVLTGDAIIKAQRAVMEVRDMPRSSLAQNIITKTDNNFLQKRFQNIILTNQDAHLTSIINSIRD